MATVSTQQQPNLDLSKVKVEFFKFDEQQKFQEDIGISLRLLAKASQ